MIDKTIFVNAIQSIEQQISKDSINSELIKEAFEVHMDYLHDTSLLQKQIIELLSIWFNREELEYFCYFCNFGRLNEESIEDFYERLIKTKK